MWLDVMKEDLIDLPKCVNKLIRVLY